MGKRGGDDEGFERFRAGREGKKEVHGGVGREGWEERISARNGSLTSSSGEECEASKLLVGHMLCSTGCAMGYCLWSRLRGRETRVQRSADKARHSHVDLTVQTVH
jgi:hypothetical protein